MGFCWEGGVVYLESQLVAVFCGVWGKQSSHSLRSVQLQVVVFRPSNYFVQVWVQSVLNCVRVCVGGVECNVVSVGDDVCVWVWCGYV